jgi:hypothetical protein
MAGFGPAAKEYAGLAETSILAYQLNGHSDDPHFAHLILVFMAMSHPRISADPDVMMGKPCIKGTRITVELNWGRGARSQT